MKQKFTVLVSKVSSQKSTKKTNGNDPSGGKGRECFKCGKFEHLAVDCRMDYILNVMDEDMHPEIAPVVTEVDRTIMARVRQWWYRHSTDSWNRYSFLDIWFCPDGALNLFSVKKADQKGIDQDIRNNGLMWTFLDGKTITMAVSVEGNLYQMAVIVAPEDLCCR